MEIGFVHILAAFLLISVLVTLAIKKFTKHETHFIISIIRTQKPLSFFDRMARHTKILDVFAAIGLYIGFGALSVDFFYGRRQEPLKRVAVFIASFSLLALAIIGVDSFLGNGLSKSLLVGSSFPLMVASFGLMGLSGFTLFSLLLQGASIISNYFVGIKSCPGVAPLVPGVEIPGVPITPPIHAWISLIIILLVHEGMHGILGRRHGFAIKSTGILLFGPLPIGAFVEPDEKELARAEDEKALPFLAAGPMANISLMAISGILFLVSVIFFTALTNQLYPGVLTESIEGIRVLEVLDHTTFCGQEYPSTALGAMKAGDVIKEINGAEIRNFSGLFSALQKDRFEEKNFLMDRNGSMVLLTLQPNDAGQFGFRPDPIINESFKIPGSYVAYATVVDLIVNFLYWLFLLNFLVASINFLPMHPFDGGRMAKLMLAPYADFLKRPREETQRIIGKAFLTIILALLIINALPLFI